MNCQEFWDTLPEPESGEASAHLQECSECAHRMQSQRRLLGTMHELRREWRRTEAPEHVQSTVIAAFRSQTAFVRARSVRRSWAPLATWAAAAVFLVALSLLLVRPHEPPAARHNTHSTGLQQAAVQVNPGEEDDASANGFIPLPNAQRVDSVDNMNVVRVEVPRSAMLAVGLPVSPDRVSEMVEADVMLGPDGLARAVRFVE